MELSYCRKQAFSHDTLNGFYVKQSDKYQDQIKLKEEARNLFGSIEESKIEPMQKLEISERKKNVEFENIR